MAESVPLTCDQAREALWPDPANAGHRSAAQHFTACVACQRFFAAQRQLDGRLAALPRPRAPDLLRARVRLRVLDRGRRTWAIGLGMLATAAVLLFAVLGPARDDPARAFARAAARLAETPTAERLADPDSAVAWLSARLGTAIGIPDITGASFMDAHVVQIRGRPAAVAHYEMKGMAVAWFALSDGMEVGSTIRALRSGRWEVAVWSEPGGVRAIAAARPLSQDEVLMMAEECRDKALMPRT